VHRHSETAVLASIPKPFFIRFDEIEVLDSTAVGYGRFKLSLSPTGGGTDTEMVGKALDIFRRQSDGAWKFARCIFNFAKPSG